MSHKLEQIIGYEFKDKSLLEMALTHSSYAHEHNVPDYDRLEFLGDSVLEMVISEDLYKRFPKDTEGDLSDKRIALVNNGTIKKSALKLGLNKYMKIIGANTAFKAKADIFESVIGAMYLDGGLDVAKQFIINNLSEDIKNSESLVKKNYKSMLKEKFENEEVDYRVVKEEGEPHDKIYTICVEVNGVIYGPKKGKSKKEAEQLCAKVALETLGIIAKKQ